MIIVEEGLARSHVISISTITLTWCELRKKQLRNDKLIEELGASDGVDKLYGVGKLSSWQAAELASCGVGKLRSWQAEELAS